MKINPFRMFVRNILRWFGYDLHSLPMPWLTLRDLPFDLPQLILNTSPRLIDVGANKGQTINLFQSSFSNPLIYAFEPNPDLAKNILSEFISPNCIVENAAVGAKSGTLGFHIMENNELSSAYKFDTSHDNPFRNDRVKEKIEVPVVSLDEYFGEELKIPIDLLKCDTQGYDLEVLKGAESLLDKGLIKNVLIEVNFINVYQSQSSFGDIELYLRSKGLGLLTLYEITRIRRRMRWATAWFSLDDEGMNKIL